MEVRTGGSTGSEFFLDVEYAKADTDLNQKLFVKFSRDFSNPIRDQACVQLEAEVRFAPEFQENEGPRVHLQMFTTFLDLLDTKCS
jgi:hypothetical protein